jgi:hypothetical protein
MNNGLHFRPRAIGVISLPEGGALFIRAQTPPFSTKDHTPICPEHAPFHALLPKSRIRPKYAHCHPPTMGL